MSPSEFPTNVLLVSDDPGIFEIRARLADMFENWNVSSVSSAQKALNQLEADDEIDAVVVGHRVADAEARMLLDVLSASFPQIARVAVAQSASGARALETARAADSAVDLPVDVADLQYSLERAVALRWQLNDPQLQELLNEVENLPSPPEALVELSSLLSQSSIEIPQVAAVVESDPAMTAKLMQLVNSAYFGLPQKMTDVRQIVSYLGLNTVRNLLTAMEMLNAFPDIEADLKEDVQVHRQHAMSVAELARRIVKTQAAQHDAFSGGMLHDIGLLALMSCAPNRYRSLKSEVQSGRMPFDVCELEVIGTTHAAFGAQLMKNWMLPTPIVEAVARSHDADLLSDRIPHATHAVFVAEQAVSSSSEDPWWETSRQPDPVYLHALGWSELF